uniref:Venom protein n=1 Tax=Parastrongyloides trichosuri TaxID=131310 RepID=A0A0N4ZPX8_PARTI
MLLSFLIFISLTKVYTIDDECIPGKVTGIQKKDCLCCKMNCWSVKAMEAAEVLGHTPGEDNENEALETLENIKNCVLASCSNLCKTIFRPRPYFNTM